MMGRFVATLLAVCLSACSWAEKPLTLEDLQARAADANGQTSPLFWSQAERRVAFKHIRELMPTRLLAASENPYPLGSTPVDLSEVTYKLEGETHRLDDHLKREGLIGMIVVQDGNVLLEHYAPGNDENSVWVSFSVTKSVTSMLIGAAIRDGYIQSVDEPVTNYLPRLRGTPYDVATIKDVLNMASGIRWNEDYADPGSDVAKAGAANGLQLVQYLATLPREAEAGDKFNYNTGETNLVGEILRAAIGNNASAYLSRKIWQPFGMESDAYWMLDSPYGAETGGCCISATLRDYARIGLFALNGGKLRDGTAVVPEGWMADSTSPSKGADYYGYLWWLFGDRGYSALGIFGQQIRIDPEHNLVIAVHSNGEAAVDSPYHAHHGAAVEAIRDYLVGR